MIDLCCKVLGFKQFLLTCYNIVFRWRTLTVLVPAGGMWCSCMTASSSTAPTALVSSALFLVVWKNGEICDCIRGKLTG